MSATPTFPAMPQMRERVPLGVWRAARLVSVLTAMAVCGLLVADGALGLKLVWGVIVPALPLLFVVAPGFWRNVCPIAAVNQAPRVFGFSLARSLPGAARRYSFLVAVALFVVIVPLRPALLETSGTALALLFALTLVAAFAGGLVFKGKSGFCGTFCPLAPVQRLYGHTPFAVVRNSHCNPCVGCQKNCYDFNPHVALIADVYDEDATWAGSRKVFAGLLPGFVFAFFALSEDLSTPELYGGAALVALASLGSFFVLDLLLAVSTVALMTLYGAIALVVYYWYALPRAAEVVVESSPGWFVWSGRLAVAALAAVWIVRAVRKERLVLGETTASLAGPVRLGVEGKAILEEAAQDGSPEVTVMPDNRRIAAASGSTLLEVAERDGLALEAGCRMGVCGSDPITVVDGAENLSELTDDERNTLDRLGVAEGTRMACCARVQGSVSVSLAVESRAAGTTTCEHAEVDPSVRRVVVIGNGIAGVTAADHVRRRNPDCEIDIVGRERHHLYNRMAISRLIYGRSGMQGLYLLPESWYDQNRITCWLNTRAVRIDREGGRLELATGEALSFDRLIMTSGSSSFVPPIEGFGASGTFVLREAEDAMLIRSYVQDFGASRAVVAGGGLLGLEAGYALHKLGLHVTVLERGEWLLRRQLDEPASRLLQSYLENLGLDVVLGAEAVAVEAGERVSGVVLRTGSKLPCDLFLVSAGIRSNLEIAREAGLEVGRGIVVDDELRTSAPELLAAGDAAEHRGTVSGLWPAAVDQGRIAGINAVGGHERYEGSLPVTMLKVTGVDLMSAGRFEPEPGDLVVAIEDQIEGRYRKLVVSDGRIVGAILLGYPVEARAVTEAMKAAQDIRPLLPRLEAGDWSALSTDAAA